MADFSIHATGGRAAEQLLGRLLARFGDLLPLMDLVGRYLVEQTRHRFESGLAPDGTPWLPSIRARTEGGQTLVKSGQLRDSITHLPTSQSVEIGSNKIYAAVHQLGATIRPTQAQSLMFELPGGLGLIHAQEVTIPARPYLGVSATDELGILRHAEAWALAA